MATTKKASAKKAPAKKAAAKSAPKKAAKKVSVKKAAPRRPAATKNPFALGDKGRYHVEVEMNDEKFSGNTDTIARSVETLRPDHISTKVIMRFSLAGVKSTKANPAKTIEQVMMIPKARRIFANTMSADILEKFVKMGLGDFNV